MASSKAKRPKSILEDELGGKEKELQRSIRLVLAAAEKSMAHVRKLVDHDQIPIMITDVPIQELVALCGLFLAAGELKDIRHKVTMRKRR